VTVTLYDLPHNESASWRGGGTPCYSVSELIIFKTTKNVTFTVFIPYFSPFCPRRPFSLLFCLVTLCPVSEHYSNRWWTAWCGGDVTKISLKESFNCDCRVDVYSGSGTLCGFHTYVGADDMWVSWGEACLWRLYNVDCELYLLLIQWLSTYVYPCTRPPATVTNPHIVLSLGSKETHIQSHNPLA